MYWSCAAISTIPWCFESQQSAAAWLEFFKSSQRGLSEFLYLYKSWVKPPLARLEAILRRNACPEYPAGFAHLFVRPHRINMLRDMNFTDRFASRVFRWSAIYGLLALLPLYFLEETLGQRFPPAFNRPEQFYGFLGVALAWQFAFLLIATDTHRYRLFMLPAVAEKFLSSGSALVLYAGGRINGATVAPSTIDFVIGCLFLAAYFVTAKPSEGVPPPKKYAE
jgi:hypothetical protein